ncbi:CerR family C-terminal domain-containing protein [Polaromonas jejuensis]|uniref:CerR family C-terminal domain-containing protein n=1 Tax=Polaromonas jejuensis TaxID=457502 RepID=A0ABW0Q6Q0_9BURK|nr:CerR family C-terminal domain-containing protein [Polaromonas jejuensis]
MNASRRPKTPLRFAGPQGASRKQRADGVEARAQLLHAALRLFSEKGFAKTSTREIAQAAGANVAAISYYFGDKAGLYRAVFTEPIGSARDDIALYNQPHFTLRQSLQGFFAGFLEPMRQGELVQLCTRLHFREMLEPTGLWAEEVDNGLKPAHAALVAVLCRHLALAEADDDVHRLAFSITGLAVQLFISRDVVEVIRPQLFGTPEAIARWAGSLVGYAEAMVAVEAARRSTAPTHRSAASPVRMRTASHEKV